MLAVRVDQHGGPEVLRAVDVPVPEPGPGEVLVRNAWVGVNLVDLAHRTGSPYPVPLPLVPGTEASGVVTAVGPGVDDEILGRRVVHLGHLSGVYAEMTAVPVEFVVPVEGVPLDDLAALAMAGTTAHVLVRLAGRVGPGTTVVVTAAAGSTGGAVVQLAAAAGAEVVAVASTAAKLDEARGLGAHHGVLADDAAVTVRDVLGRGADLVLDAVAGPTVPHSLAMLGPRGRLVLYGMTAGPPAPLDLRQLSGLTGAGPGSLAVEFASASDYLREPAARRTAVARMTDDVRAGHLRPRVVARLPLREAAEAHRLLAARGVNGKVLLEVDGTR